MAWKSTERLVNWKWSLSQPLKEEKSKNNTWLPIQIHKWSFAQNYTQTASFFPFFFRGGRVCDTEHINTQWLVDALLDQPFWSTLCMFSWFWISSPHHAWVLLKEEPLGWVHHVWLSLWPVHGWQPPWSPETHTSHTLLLQHHGVWQPRMHCAHTPAACEWKLSFITSTSFNRKYSTIWLHKCQTVKSGEFEVMVPLVFGMTFTHKSFLFTRTGP